MTELYHIVAVSQDRVIGKNNKLPWHFSADLKHFKEITTGSTVIMGRKTFESIGKPLPGRENFIVSRGAVDRAREKEVPAGAQFFQSIDDVLKSVKTEKAFIIGGQSLYEQTLDRIDGIYLTKVKGRYEGDAFYPEIPPEFIVQKKEKSKDDSNLEFIYYENTSHCEKPRRGDEAIPNRDCFGNTWDPASQ